MKRLFHLIVAAVFATALLAGCQKYDDSDLRRQIQELREKLQSLEAWCSNSQSAIDAVAVLQEVVKNMNSVESIDPFIDADGATGYVITFTNKQTIKLYNGKDGDTFFGNVVVKDDCIEFTLADGRKFTVPRKQDEHNYLAFEAVEAGATVSMEIIGEVDAPSLEYSTNKLDWTPFDFSNPQTITLKNVGDKVYWRNTNKSDHFSASADNFIHFDLGEKKIAAEGNVMSLIDSSCKSVTISSDDCFTSLFASCASLVSAPELPAEELAYGCYSKMFRGCSSLVKAPRLDATNLASHCYNSMFASCTSLEEAPELPATKLARSSYNTMFRGCSALKKAPELPALELDEYCYQGMFYGCTSLNEAPSLPATELALSCYSLMFYECTSLTEAPLLPAMKMEEECYDGMFWVCTSLKEAPELPATELALRCYTNMFMLCESLEEAPKLPAQTLAEDCYYMMFAGCYSLEKAPELPATSLSPLCYYGMFEECTALEEAPELPAETLAPSCYYIMFMNCSSLKEAPELPATELVNDCYAGLFYGCSELETAPYLPASVLAPGCYDSMFYDCSNLKSINVAFTDWNDGNATPDWVYGVGSEGNFECPEGLAVQYGDSFIPNGWSVNGAAPVATKSCATSTIKSIGESHCKLFSPKTMNIMDWDVERELIRR